MSTLKGEAEGTTASPRRSPLHVGLMLKPEKRQSVSIPSSGLKGGGLSGESKGLFRIALRTDDDMKRFANDFEHGAAVKENGKFEFRKAQSHLLCWD